MQESYPKELCAVEAASPLERYKTQRNHIEQRLQKLDEVIQALEKNPEVCRIIELMNKANY